MNNKKKPNLPPVRTPAPEGSTTSKSERRAAAAVLMKEQKRRARRRTIVVQTGIGALVVVLVIAVTSIVLSRRGPDGDATPPPGLTSDGAIRFGTDGAGVTVQAVEDFQCPVCQQFEKTNAALLAGYRDGGEVAVEYRPIAFLDRMSSTEYSSRALNASACVLAESGKEAWLTFHQALYDNQPPEQSKGLPDSDLISMAADAGADGDDVASCINDRRYDGWVQQTTEDTMGKNGVTGTPTVFVNGKKLDGFDADTITAAVEAAGAS